MAAVVLSNEEESFFLSRPMRRSSSQTRLVGASSTTTTTTTTTYHPGHDLADSYHQPSKAFSDSDQSSPPSSPRTAHIESADASYNSTPASNFSIASDYESLLGLDDSSDDPFGLPPFTPEKLYIHPELRPADTLKAPSNLHSSTSTSSGGGCDGGDGGGSDAPSSPIDQDGDISNSRPDTPDFSEKAEDDSAIVNKPSRQVDYLSHEWKEEEIWSSWRYITSKRGEFPNSARLENASWRTWIKAKYHLGTVSPETLNWLKDCDVTWLYGPLQSRASSLYINRTEPTSTSLSKSDSLMNLTKKPILKKRSMSEIMLQRSLSTASLLKQATAAVHAQESSKELRPALSRANTDYHTYSFSPRRGSQESNTLAASTDSSSITSPSSERRHIHFNEQVEQCIAVDVKGDDDDEIAIDMYGEDSASDDGVMMKRVKSKRRPPTKKRLKKTGTAEGKIIAKLPSTTLKYQEDTHDFTDSAMKHSTGVSHSAVLSPSSSQETLRPAKPSARFFFAEEPDDDLDQVAQSSSAGWRTPSNGAGGLHRSTSSNSLFDEPTGMRRTPSGMFMPYDEEPDASGGEGLFGRVIDTVNTARDIAHVIWNVGWRK